MTLSDILNGFSAHGTFACIAPNGNLYYSENETADTCGEHLLSIEQEGDAFIIDSSDINIIAEMSKYLFDNGQRFFIAS
jgi:hypothetical protein